MPSNQTANYQLSQWEPGDQVLRADFNADNTKLDAALAVLAGRIEYGTYVGTGSFSESWSGATTLRLGYCPKLVLVAGEGDTGLGIFLYPTAWSSHLNQASMHGLAIQWLEDGVQWRDTNPSTQQARGQFNSKDVTYHYIAFR